MLLFSFGNLSLCFLCQAECVSSLSVSLLWKLRISEAAVIVCCFALQELCMMISMKMAAYLLASATANSMERGIHLEKPLAMSVKNGKDHHRRSPFFSCMCVCPFQSFT